MRTLIAVLGFGAILIMLLAGAFIALAVELLPYVLLGIAIGAIVGSRRRQHARLDRPPVPPALRQQPLPAGGWVYVPVWVAPPPQPMRAIDAEFVRDPRDG
jgi:hypothetical protein